MIQRRIWKDITASDAAWSTSAALPNGEGTMILTVGTMAFQGMSMSYQFTGPHPDDIAEQAARWIIQNTGKDEVEQLSLIVGEHSFVLTKVGTAVVVSPSLIKPKVYR